MNEESISKKVLKTIREYELIGYGDSIIVGVSGGPDSMCLLSLLRSFRESMGIELTAVHVNHMLRGQESEDDQKYILNCCREWSIPFIAESINVREESLRLGLSVEEAGREGRYMIFTRILKEKSACLIAVGHNKNDLVETVLMNLIRGTGSDGLVGIKHKQGVIIRPLLDITRFEIEDYCRLNNILPRIDKTNFQEIYTRNKIRYRLIPEINNIMETDITDGIYRMSQILAEENKLLNKLALDEMEKIITVRKADEICIALKGMLSIERALIGRVIRAIYEQLTGSKKGLEYKHIEDISNLIEKNRTGSRINFPKGVNVVISYGRIIFYRGRIEGHEDFDYELSIPGEAIINDLGIKISSDIIEADGKKMKPSENSATQYFDYDCFKSGIYIRNRRNGDTIKPYNSPGEKKLKDYFIDIKVPRIERGRIPLVADGKNIVWVIGKRTNDNYKISGETRKVIRISYEHI